jgi:hypothetical protein
MTVNVPMKAHYGDVEHSQGTVTTRSPSTRRLEPPCTPDSHAVLDPCQSGRGGVLWLCSEIQATHNLDLIVPPPFLKQHLPPTSTQRASRTR